MAAPFTTEPDPDHPGWMRWGPSQPGLFNESMFGLVLIRAEDEGRRGRVRIFPRPSHANIFGSIHGGVALAFIDICLFGGARAVGVPAEGGTTVGITTQFMAPGRLDQPLDAVVEVLHETTRLLFLRGLLEQEAGPIASFTGTVRKASATRPADGPVEGAAA